MINFFKVAPDAAILILISGVFAVLTVIALVAGSLSLGVLFGTTALAYAVISVLAWKWEF